ncbi:hypothetical protein [Miltoncostaea marina]|uniref:hypothetical protein n=1 Tax=Miltoncostaea marina TaxID=2843215 RepID=UPI001C3D0830|nr:hypothetical protein [Miltoncostaea marina]
MRAIRRRPLAGLVAVAAAAAVIAGCGDDGGSGLSADEFRERADAICADAERQLDGLEEPTSAEGLLPFLRSGLEIQNTQLEALKGLEPPEDLKGTFDEAVALLEDQQDEITATADRIEAGEDAETVIREADPKIDGINDQADAKAKELGLTVCGSEDDDVDTDTDTGTSAGTATAPAATTGTAPETTGGTDTSPVGQTNAYVDDVQAAAAALQSFGTTLQSSTGLEDLKSKIPGARTDLDEFDAAISKLENYSLPTDRLERQRTGLLRTGPQVSDVLRRFLDAAEDGDAAGVQNLLPEVQKTIGEFQQAATAS